MKGLCTTENHLANQAAQLREKINKTETTSTCKKDLDNERGLVASRVVFQNLLFVMHQMLGPAGKDVVVEYSFETILLSQILKLKGSVKKSFQSTPTQLKKN